MAFRCLLSTSLRDFCLPTGTALCGRTVKSQGSYLSLRYGFCGNNAKEQSLLANRACQYVALRSYSIGRCSLILSDRIHKRRDLPASGDFKITRSFFEDRKTKALTIFQDLKHIKSSPMPALVLGLSGLLPFVAAPAYLVMSNVFLDSIAVCQVAYGATILSFLGGVRWGLTLTEESGVKPNWFNLSYSVTPPLVAWLGLMIPSVVMSNLILVAGLAGAAYFDTVLWGYPPWFKALRFMLSFVAILSLWTTLMCKMILRDSKLTSKIENENDS